MIVWICDQSTADGFEGGMTEGEEVSLEKVKAKNSKLLHKGNDDEG